MGLLEKRGFENGAIGRVGPTPRIGWRSTALAIDNGSVTGNRGDRIGNVGIGGNLVQGLALQQTGNQGDRIGNVNVGDLVEGLANLQLEPLKDTKIKTI